MSTLAFSPSFPVAVPSCVEAVVTFTPACSKNAFGQAYSSSRKRLKAIINKMFFISQIIAKLGVPSNIIYNNSSNDGIPISAKEIVKFRKSIADK